MIRGVLIVLAACGGTTPPAKPAPITPVEVRPPEPPKPPVAAGTKLGCAGLVDRAAFEIALGEPAALELRDEADTDATATCSLVRGGPRPTAAEQQAMLKRMGRIGLVSGDVVCEITLACERIVDEATLRAKCKAPGDRDDDTMGTYACVKLVAAGTVDLKVFRFVDADTRCVMTVRGGPTNFDDELVKVCAMMARDTIGPLKLAR